MYSRDITNVWSKVTQTLPDRGHIEAEYRQEHKSVIYLRQFIRDILLLTMHTIPINAVDLICGVDHYAFVSY